MILMKIFVVQKWGLRWLAWIFTVFDWWQCLTKSENQRHRRSEKIWPTGSTAVFEKDDFDLL